MTYIENLERLADEAYEKHTLVEQLSPTSWRIRRQDSSTFITTLIADPPFLILVGDAETAVFYGHASDTPLGLVHWVAGSNLDYLATKIDSGMRVPGAGLVTDVRSAVIHLEACKADALIDVVLDEERDRITASWDEAIELARRGDVSAAREHVASELEGWEIAGDIGRVVAPRVVYAREACRTLVRLLSVQASSQASYAIDQADAIRHAMEAGKVILPPGVLDQVGPPISVADAYREFVSVGVDIAKPGSEDHSVAVAMKDGKVIDICTDLSKLSPVGRLRFFVDVARSGKTMGMRLDPNQVDDVGALLDEYSDAIKLMTAAGIEPAPKESSGLQLLGQLELMRQEAKDENDRLERLIALNRAAAQHCPKCKSQHADSSEIAIRDVATDVAIAFVGVDEKIGEAILRVDVGGSTGNIFITRDFCEGLLEVFEKKAEPCPVCKLDTSVCGCTREELEAAGVDCGPNPCGRCGNEATVDMECGAGRGWRCGCGAKLEELENELANIRESDGAIHIPDAVGLSSGELAVDCETGRVWLSRDFIVRMLEILDEKECTPPENDDPISGMSLDLLRKIGRGFFEITRAEFEQVLAETIHASREYAEGVWPSFREHPTGYCMSRQPSSQGDALFALAIKKVKAFDKQMVTLSEFSWGRLREGLRVAVIATTAKATLELVEALAEVSPDATMVSPVAVFSALIGARFDLVVIADEVDQLEPSVAAWLKHSVQARLAPKWKCPACEKTDPRNRYVNGDKIVCLNCGTDLAKFEADVMSWGDGGAGEECDPPSAEDESSEDGSDDQ